MAQPPTKNPQRRRQLAIVGGVITAALVGFLALFFLGDAPDEVSIETAVDAVGTSASDQPSPVASETTSGPVDPQGTWNVDTEAQPYSFEESTGTFVGFRIDEELSRVGNATAVGRTPAVTGTITLVGQVITEAAFAGDLSILKTDESRRDSRARRSLKASEFPETTFVLLEPINLGTEPAVGERITAEAVGELTVAGVTQPRTIQLEAVVSEAGVLVVTTSFDVALADHDVEKPSSFVVLSIADVATVEVQLYLTKA